VECHIDFARMGMVFDSVTGRRRVVHALIFTAVFLRHMFVWLMFSQTLEAILAGCEAAWRFFGGVFKVLIPDNTGTIVVQADSVNPRFTVGWLEYAQARGFLTDPAPVAHPQDKPRVERMVQYVRNNFFAGEDFADLADAQDRAETWCRDKAGQRVKAPQAHHFARFGCVMGLWDATSGVLHGQSDSASSWARNVADTS
jgi:transposase